MKRISKQTKAIADAHLQAKITGQFDDPKVSTREEIIDQLRAGKTFTDVLVQVEIRYCSITSLVMDRFLDHQSATYKSAVYKGFKALLD